MAQAKELEEYRVFTKPAELHKAINTLKGIVSGITMENGVSADELIELTNWCALHVHLLDRHPFSELIPMIQNKQQGGTIAVEDSHDILWLCNNFVSNSSYYDNITSSLQYLFGILHGMMADNELSDSEIKMLSQWVDTHDFLRGCYPFDEIDSLLTVVLLDGKIVDSERNMLAGFFSNFIDTSMSHNINAADLDAKCKELSISGVCAVDPAIKFRGRTFCFTGKSYVSTRDEITDIVEDNGGTFHDSVTKSVDYLVVGNASNPCWAYACYGRKVEQAIDLRKKGGKILIVNEVDFWDASEK